jgi:hypothetical protein
VTLREPPRFYGVDTHKDALGRFSIRFPSTWTQLSVEGSEGVSWVPNANDLATVFSVTLTRLATNVVAEDFDDVRAGVEEGLAQLPDCHVESTYEAVLSNLLKFERVFTFREAGETRKRKQWLLYVDTWLMVLTWQGCDVEEFDYWLAMANYMFATFEIPEALWFATDRDLAGLNTRD